MARGKDAKFNHRLVPLLLSGLYKMTKNHTVACSHGVIKLSQGLLPWHVSELTTALPNLPCSASFACKYFKKKHYSDALFAFLSARSYRKNLLIIKVLLIFTNKSLTTKPSLMTWGDEKNEFSSDHAFIPAASSEDSSKRSVSVSVDCA